MSLVVNDSMIVAGGAECKKNLTVSVLQLSSDLRAVGMVTSRGLDVGEITVTKASLCNSVNLMKDAHTNGSGKTKFDVTARDGMVVGGTATLSANTFACQSLVANNWQLYQHTWTQGGSIVGGGIKLTTSSAVMRDLNTTGRLTVYRTIVVDGFTKTDNMSVAGKLVVDDDFTVNGNANNATIRARQTFSTPTSGLVTISSATMGDLVTNTYTANNFTSNNMSCPNNLTAGTLSVGKDLDVQNTFRVGGELTFTDTLFSRGDINIAVNAIVTKELTLSALKIKDTSSGFGCNLFSNTSDTKFTKQMKADKVVVKGLGALHTGDIKLSSTSKIDFGHMNIVANGRVSGFNDVYFANGTFVTQDLGYTKEEFFVHYNNRSDVCFTGSYKNIKGGVSTYTKKEVKDKIREKLVKLRKINDDLTTLSEYASSPKVMMYDVLLVHTQPRFIYTSNAAAFIATAFTAEGVTVPKLDAGTISCWSFSQETPTQFRQCEVDRMAKGSYVEVQNKLYFAKESERYRLIVLTWFWFDSNTLQFTKQEWSNRYLPELLIDEKIRGADQVFVMPTGIGAEKNVYASYMPTYGRPPEPPAPPAEKIPIAVIHEEFNFGGTWKQVWEVPYYIEKVADADDWSYFDNKIRSFRLIQGYTMQLWENPGRSGPTTGKLEGDTGGFYDRIEGGVSCFEILAK